MSPAQAAILGRPAPVATVAPAPMLAPGGLPISPAQAAVLGLQGGAGAGTGPLAPVAGVGGGGALPDPMAALLIARANREGPIDTGVGLLGRLAALGVGTKLSRENQRAQRDAAMEFAQSIADPEAAAIARYAILSGAQPGEVVSALMTMRGQNIDVRGQDVSAETTRRGQDITQSESQANRALDRSLGTADLQERKAARLARTNLEAAAFGEQQRSNQATETLARDRLEYEKARDDADRIAELAAAGGKAGKLSEVSAKAISNATNAAPALELLASPDLRYHRLDPTTLNFIQSLIAAGGDNVINSAVKLFRAKQYETMPEQDKRMILHGLTLLDAAARDVSGAALTAADLAIKSAQIFNMPDDSPRIMDEKRQVRQTMVDAMLQKIPEGQLPPSLMSDEQLRAIAGDGK